MLRDLAIIRSPGTRYFFLASVALSAIIVIGANSLPGSGIANRLAPIFLYLYTTGDYQAANCALLILVAAAAISGNFPARALLRWIGEHPGAIAAGAFVALSLGTWLVYQNTRVSMDEYAQFFQSQVFAAGHVAGQFPAPLLDWLVPKGFQNFFLNVSRIDGRVASNYWPSFALILAPFTKLGIPWACNPSISAVTLLSIHRLTLQIFGGEVETAGLALLLTVASPVFFADGISYYSMSAHLLANTLFASLLVGITRRRAFVAGIVGSVALTLHNPVPHILFALPWIIWLLRQPGKLALVGWLFAGYVPLCLLFGFGWFLFSSHLAHAGLTLSAGTTDVGHSLSQVASVAALPSTALLLARLVAIAKVWTWSVPGLMLLALYGSWHWRRNPWCLLIATSALLTLVMYVFVPADQGHGWGYRYFHSAWMVLPILGAGAFVRRAPAEYGLLEDHGVRTFVVACALLTLLVGIGLRAVQMHDFIVQHESQAPQYSGTERRVVILDPRLTFYGADMVQNDPWLRGDVIRMITHGPSADAQMMSTYFADLHRVYQDQYGSVWSAK